MRTVQHQIAHPKDLVQHALCTVHSQGRHCANNQGLVLPSGDMCCTCLTTKSKCIAHLTAHQPVFCFHDVSVGDLLCESLCRVC